MRALIVGADGFVGRHLAAHLREQGDTVLEGVGPNGAAGRHQRRLDVTDVRSLEAALEWAAPDAVYHLAAVAYGPDAAADLTHALTITVTGTGNLLGAVERLAPEARVLVTGSSEVYGDPELTSIPEAARLEPINLYGATKVAQEAVALAFARSRGLTVAVTRSFNHAGPGQRDSFAVPSFARQLRMVELGRAPAELRVGNLAPVRDFSDVRDVVRAYRSLIREGHAGQAVNVASERGVSIGDVLQQLVGISGLAVEVTVDPARVRATDPKRLVGDARLLKKLTGWQPRIPLERTLTDVWSDAQMRWQ
ncbi:MAG: GDP-mannose 4,6-dehydratase [Chloroflexi bacterium]|nr:GDP-mannose 4,6-dehydratase [Chloroflexota bacterium]